MAKRSRAFDWPRQISLNTPRNAVLIVLEAAASVVPEITMEYEITLVTNKILKLELKETRDVLGAQKKRQIDKRTIIKGQYYIITKPILKKIKNADAEIEKRRRPRKKDNKKKELLDVIEVLSDDDKEDDEEIEQA